MSNKLQCHVCMTAIYIIMVKTKQIFCFGGVSKAWAVKAPPSSGKGAGSSSSFAFKETCTKTACLRFCFCFASNFFQYDMINYLWGILSWNLTDTFWGHLRLILHLVKRGIISPLWRGSLPKKWTFCHHLLTLMSFQTCMGFLLMLHIKEDILKNAGNQTIDGPHWLP